MKDSKEVERLSPLAGRAWERLALEFPFWKEHLGTRDGELEFAVPAPSGSAAGHLVASSHGNQLWVRFSPNYLSYPADDEDEMVSIIRQLTDDSVVFRVVAKGDEWVETSLTKWKDEAKPLPGQTVRFISWSGKCDR